MRHWFFIALSMFLLSCVSLGPQYFNENIDSDKLKAFEGESSYIIYFVGDAGNAPMGESINVLKYLNADLPTNSEHSAIVWLGDNIYPVGLAPEKDDTYDLGLHRLQKQLEIHDQFNGKIFFIPGNHDWYKWGREGIQRQEKIIETYLSEREIHDSKWQDNYFLPDNGCGKVHAISLTDDIVLILMDSAWFLKQTLKPETILDCEGNTRKYFLDQVSARIEENKDKSIVMALHHPPYTYGSHGGHFKSRDYILPLTQLKSNLVLPLPFTGYIVNRMRQYISEQDVKHSRYKLLRNHIKQELEKAGASLVAAGHEHNLQYIETVNNYYVISGAGSKNNPGTLGEGSQFFVGQKGFVKLIFKNAIDAIVEFYVVDGDGESAELLYQKEITFKI